jgi:YHS domain-containing protein
MEFLPWLLRAILITVSIRFVVRLIGAMMAPAQRPSTGPSGPRPAPPRPAERVGGTLVRDPHCGTYVPENRAIRAGSGASAQYFCSEDCRRAYLAAHTTAHSA